MNLPPEVKVALERELAADRIKMGIGNGKPKNVTIEVGSELGLATFTIMSGIDYNGAWPLDLPDEIFEEVTPEALGRKLFEVMGIPLP